MHTGVLALPILKPKKYKKRKNNAKILIQYPIRNEPKEIIERFFKSLYTIPESERSRFLLQVLDDYDAEMIWRFESPIETQYLKRTIRTGNKAGNMNFGLSKADASYKYVAIYDADHQIEGKGLIEAVEILEANQQIVCVQSRWTFANADNSMLSLLQQQSLGMHIQREQTFRSRVDLYPIFNGAGAVWNRSIVEKEAGGWITRCVCEDTDLSGVMHMRGYKIHVLPSWETKTDLVEDWTNYKKQQRRWIKGNGQQLQYHARTNEGWGLKKLYWLSWNMGFGIGFMKYLIPLVMIYKWYFGVAYNAVDQVNILTHILAYAASCLDWKNDFKPKGLVTYPLHYFLELKVLHHQILGFFEGFFGYKKHFDFEVTQKGSTK